MHIFKDPPPPVAPAPPRLQLARPDGTVRYLTGGDATAEATAEATGEAFHAPNDLCVAPDCTVYFTDPGHFPPPDEEIGRVFEYTPDDELRVIASGFWFCNGIALDRDGDLVVVERLGLQRVHRDGTRE